MNLIYWHPQSRSRLSRTTSREPNQSSKTSCTQKFHTASTIFTYKGLSPKECLALQIIAYSTISLISEKFEPDPQISIESFAPSEHGSNTAIKTANPANPASPANPANPTQALVESVNICSKVWDIVASSAQHTSNTLFGKLLELNASVKTREDLDSLIEESITLAKDVSETFRVIEEFLLNGELSEERIQLILGALGALAPTQAPTQGAAPGTQGTLATTANQQKHSGRSKTLRVHGRRAITPIRSRHNHNHNKRPATNSE